MLYAGGLYNEVKKENEMRTDVSKFVFYSMANLFIKVNSENIPNKACAIS